jgi:hypothetical protein
VEHVDGEGAVRHAAEEAVLVGHAPMLAR